MKIAITRVRILFSQKAWLTAISLAAFSSCTYHVGSLLPDEGHYKVAWDGEAERELVVLGTGPRRTLRETCPTGDGGSFSCTRAWVVKDSGIVEESSGSVLLTSNLVAGARWHVAGKEGPCHIWRQILSMGADWVEVEERGYCEGQPMPVPTLVSRWRARSGPVHEQVGGSRIRTVRREENTDAGK
jgi:hypothetical protein